MDRPILHPFVQSLRETERLRGYAEAFPANARVSEPALPLLLAALHEELDRPLVLLAPEDADARDAAEAAAWFVGEERVALLPSRGVHWGSGLEPAPHLVGERARALDILAAGGLVCASAAALAEGMPPSSARPEPIRIAPGVERSLEGLAEALALAGYERVERADERGQFAVRGGLVDVFPTTGREPLRIELFGDEIEQIRAFSPFTQRALRGLDTATIFPAGERRRDLVELTLEDDVPDDLVLPLDRVPDLVWEPDEVREVWVEEGLREVPLDGATVLGPLPQGQPFSFDAQRPALAARGLAEAENDLGGLLRQGLDVVVAFAHQGEADRRRQLLRRVEAGTLERGDPPEGLTFVVSPARRGFVWRDLGLALLPDT
jgi:transcription-repair coupling factor (superfamily II helicase)